MLGSSGRTLALYPSFFGRVEHFHYTHIPSVILFIPPGPISGTAVWLVKS